MALTNVGRNLAAQALIGQTITPFNSANMYLGVGNSATAFAASQTDLIGASKFRKLVTTGFPTLATNVVSLSAVFGSSEANFVWAEWGVFNASSSGSMLNRKVSALGTKDSSQSWQFDVTLTFTAS